MAASSNQPPPEYDDFGFEWGTDGRGGARSDDSLDSESSPGFFTNFRSRRLERKWHQFIQDDPKFMQKAQLKNLCRQGVPQKHRIKVWTHLLSANELKRRNPGEFDRLKTQEVKEASGNVIDLDITRTFPKHRLFKTAAGQQRLRAVLRAYAARNVALGYCQSMNFVAAMLMIILRDDELAFWSMVTLIEDPKFGFEGYYLPGMAGLRRDMNVCDLLLQKWEPRMLQRLKQAGVDSTWLCGQWFLALFCTSLPMNATLRVWDCIFSEGWKILFRVTLAVCRSQAREIAQCKTTESLLELVATKKWTYNLTDVNGMLKVAFRLTLKRDNLRELRDWAMGEVRRDDEKTEERRREAAIRRAAKEKERAEQDKQARTGSSPERNDISAESTVKSSSSVAEPATQPPPVQGGVLTKITNSFRRNRSFSAGSDASAGRISRDNSSLFKRNSSGYPYSGEGSAPANVATPTFDKTDASAASQARAQAGYPQNEIPKPPGTVKEDSIPSPKPQAKRAAAPPKRSDSGKPKPAKSGSGLPCVDAGSRKNSARKSFDPEKNDSCARP